MLSDFCVSETGVMLCRRSRGRTGKSSENTPVIQRRDDADSN